MEDPVETAELLAFAKTVDARSLSRAALELGVPRATVSRRLARLEQRLGVRLLRRSTRSLVLTDAGEAFYRGARVALDAVTQAAASVRRGEASVRGPLRVSLPPMRDPSLHAAICAFAERYPEVKMQVHFSSHYVDLRREGFDVALRASTALEPGLVARTLARTAVLAVASPAYLAKHGTPKAARDLRSHRLLGHFARGEMPATHWPLLGGGGLHVEPAFSSNEPVMLLDAALRGLGVALVPLILAVPPLEDGKLSHVLPDVIGAESKVALVYAEREFLPPQVKAFVEAITAWARDDRLSERLARPSPRCPKPGSQPAKAAAKAAPRAKAKAKRAAKV